MFEGIFHVVHDGAHENVWIVIDGSGAELRRLPTREEAIERAKDMALELGGARIDVFDAGCRLVRQFNFGPDRVERLPW